jgi:hypothetical protein
LWNIHKVHEEPQHARHILGLEGITIGKRVQHKRPAHFLVQHVVKDAHIKGASLDLVLLSPVAPLLCLLSTTAVIDDDVAFSFSGRCLNSACGIVPWRSVGGILRSESRTVV